MTWSKLRCSSLSGMVLAVFRPGSHAWERASGPGMKRPQHTKHQRMGLLIGFPKVIKIKPIVWSHPAVGF